MYFCQSLSYSLFNYFFSNRVSSEPPRPFQSLRSYCDICEKFDLHDTEECPTQASEENTHYGGNRGEARPYCETCESKPTLFQRQKTDLQMCVTIQIPKCYPVIFFSIWSFNGRV